MMVLAFVALFLEVDMSDMWSFKAAMWQWQMATARFYLMRIEAQLETQVFRSENELLQNSDRLLDYQILSDIFLDTIGVFPTSIDGNLSSGFFLPASHGFRLTIETDSTGCWSFFNEANINSWVPRFGPCSFCYALCPMKQSAAMRLFEWPWGSQGTCCDHEAGNPHVHGYGFWTALVPLVPLSLPTVWVWRW